MEVTLTYQGMYNNDAPVVLVGHALGHEPQHVWHRHGLQLGLERDVAGELGVVLRTVDTHDEELRHRFDDIERAL